MNRYTLDLSIIIPVYQGADRIKPLLKAIYSQANAGDFSWEVIVVDNNSTDNLWEVIQEYSLLGIRYYVEQREGVAFARLRGVREARGEVVAFLDDDNIPAENWLSRVYYFGLETDASAWSGQCHPVYETSPPPNINRIEKMFAVCEKTELDYCPEKLILPPGAGLAVRKQAFLDAFPKIVRLSGAFLQRGDDYELLLNMHKQGGKIVYNPEMSISHAIPSFRLDKSYLDKLGWNSGIATFDLVLINAKYPSAFLAVKLILGSLKRLVLHVLNYRVEVLSDPVLSCQLQFHIATLLSPFYYCRNRLRY